MKKLLGFIALATVVGACHADDHISIMNTDCDVLFSDETHTLAKCPIIPELVEIQSQTPNAMVMSDGYLIDATDTEHMYIDVVTDDCDGGATGYRVVVQNPILDGTSMFAVHYCAE